MAREEFDYWTGTGSSPLDGQPPTSFAEALNRISSHWLSQDYLTPSPGSLEGHREGPNATEPPVGRVSCGTQTAPDAPPALQRPARWGSQDATPPSFEDSPPSRMGWSPANEAGLPYAAGQGDEGGGVRLIGKEGGWRRSEGEVVRDGQREWYQRMLLAMKLKQAKRMEDMELRFEEELRRRSEMHEAALQQMAAQAAGERPGLCTAWQTANKTSLKSLELPHGSRVSEMFQLLDVCLAAPRIASTICLTSLADVYARRLQDFRSECLLCISLRLKLQPERVLLWAPGFMPVFFLPNIQSHTSLDHCLFISAVASSSVHACAAAQEAARVLEEKLGAANEMLAGLQARLQQQGEDLELKREYDLYKLRSTQEKEAAAIAEKHQARVDQLQVRPARFGTRVAASELQGEPLC